MADKSVGWAQIESWPDNLYVSKPDQGDAVRYNVGRYGDRIVKILFASGQLDIVTMLDQRQAEILVDALTRFLERK